MDHPAVVRMERTGYYKPQPKIYGTDQLGNTVMSGEEILCINDMYFLVHVLDDTAIEVLEAMGADYSIAER